MVWVVNFRNYCFGQSNTHVPAEKNINFLIRFKQSNLKFCLPECNINIL